MLPAEREMSRRGRGGECEKREQEVGGREKREGRRRGGSFHKSTKFSAARFPIWLIFNSSYIKDYIYTFQEIVIGFRLCTYVSLVPVVCHAITKVICI